MLVLITFALLLLGFRSSAYTAPGMVRAFAWTSVSGVKIPMRQPKAAHRFSSNSKESRPGRVTERRGSFAAALMKSANDNNEVVGDTDTLLVTKDDSMTHKQTRILQDDANEQRTEDTITGPTFFGLEPKQNFDSMDNGLLFTGPLILLGSVYLMILPFITDDVPIPVVEINDVVVWE